MKKYVKIRETASLIVALTVILTAFVLMAKKIKRKADKRMTTAVMENKKVQNTSDESADMAFCLELSERHSRRKDKYAPGISFEDAVKNLGFSMEEIANAEQ